MPRLRACFVLLLVLLTFPAAAAAQEPAKKEWGYISLPDGVELKYSVWLPEGEGPFPVLMQYEGYQAGSDPSRATYKGFVPAMLKKGYAILGVSLRGSACSSGVWDLFGEQQARDGAFAVEWAAKQPWSNGKVATFGYSYGGIMQMWIAAMRPKGLVAVGPANVVADTYRDIGYPGGILNNIFPPEWGVALQADWALALREATANGDAKCFANTARHPAENAGNALAVQIVQHPYDDQWHHDHSPVNFAERIDVPVLGVRTWQDEETGGRQASWWEHLDPKKTWLVSSNGNHLVYQFASDLQPTLQGFYDHFLKGVDNGFERSPRVQIWHEASPADSNPRSVTTQRTLPVKVAETPLYLGTDGVLGNDAPTDDATTSYPYPVPSPPVVDTASQGVQDRYRENTWSQTPYVSEGRGVFTTPPLEKTVTTYGPASADLWVSTTAPDVDVQVTITEVRPDGQEVWIQRGWLRASHRALADARSTTLTPWHPHTESSLADMPAGEPQLLRVDVFPFGHTFRAGSSIRMYVEEPSPTGLWGFDTKKTPQTVTIHHGTDHPSRLVVGLLEDANVRSERPGCAALLNQACRPNPVPQPDGALDIAPSSSSEQTAPAGQLGPRIKVRFRGRRNSVLVKLRALGEPLSGVRVKLRRGGRVVARSKGLSVDGRPRRLVLRRRGGKRLANGSYTLVVRAGGALLVRRVVRLGR